MNENELRLRIAKAKGYVFAFVLPNHRGRIHPYTPLDIQTGGMPLETDIAEGTEAEIAWEHTPDWPREWGAAGELWDEMIAAGRFPSLLSFPDENRGGEITHVVLLVNAYQECPFGDTGPEAISRAYLAWREAK